MSSLPIQQIFSLLQQQFATQQNFIVGAPPGAGKSTALPLMLLTQVQLEGRILMLEPRRLAAKSIAQYLAQQLGEKVGQRVGYQMRGENKQSAQTQLLIVTEGMLTRLIQQDPELSDVALIIFDEFHERSIHADLGLALALEVQQGFNEQLKLMIMSATLETAALQTLMPDALVLNSEGRSYPIEYHYQPLARDRDWLANVARHCGQIMTQQTGSALVFLPGAREIRYLAEALPRLLDADVDLHCLFGQMDLSAQQAAIAPSASGKRKIVLATNVAETSLTIAGISCVIDSGLERQASFNAASATTRLQTRMICKSSAIQRAGRAGRLSAGQCYRLYSEEQLNHRPFAAEPEILRSDLSRLSVELLQWGASASDLHWLDMPPAAHLAQAQDLLQQLGMLDPQGQLSAQGQILADIALSPRLAAMLQQAQRWQQELGEEGLVWRACELAAFIESTGKSSSPLIEQAIQQLQGSAKRQYLQQLQLLTRRYKAKDKALDSHLWDGLLLAQAFPDRIAQQRQGSNYTLAIGAGVQLGQQQILAKHTYLVVADLFWPEGHKQAQVASASPLSLDHLLNLQSARAAWQQQCSWSESAQKLVNERRLQLGQLSLKCEAGNTIEAQQCQQAWLEKLQQKGLTWFPIGDKARAWLERARCAKQWFSDLDGPEWDDQSLLADAEMWFCPQLEACRSLNQLKKCDWLAMLKSRLSWAQLQQLEQLVPSHYVAPSGNRAAIRYQLGQAPVMAIKLQQMFGQPISPMLGNKVAIVLELLSPAGRPLQLTQDLASFWRSAYPDVKKEMKGRYPKHPWPDDPISATATAKTKRQLGNKT